MEEELSRNGKTDMRQRAEQWRSNGGRVVKT